MKTNQQLDQQILTLERQIDILDEVVKDYPTSTITNARKQIEARLKVLREKRDKEMKAWLEKSEAYKDFINTINELKTEKK